MSLGEGLLSRGLTLAGSHEKVFREQQPYQRSTHLGSNKCRYMSRCNAGKGITQ